MLDCGMHMGFNDEVYEHIWHRKRTLDSQFWSSEEVSRFLVHH